MAQLDASAFPGARARTIGERLPLRHVDFALVGAALALALYGVLMVYSATHRSQAVQSLDPTYFVKRQALFFLIGVIAMVAVAIVDYRVLRILGPVLYLLTILMLIMVRIPHIGENVLGAQRSFTIAGFQVSPSMFMRVVLVVTLAGYLSSFKGAPTLKHVIRAIIIAGIPILLVFVQPDLGTSIVLSTILLAELIIAGVRARHLVVIVLLAALGFAGALQLRLIKDYQVQRLTSFLNSNTGTASETECSACWNLRQSEVAIGAGGIAGRGYLKGSQTNLAFVPEQQTDFIFTVVGEELGFAGAIVLLLLYLLILWRAYRIAITARDPFGTYIAIGVAAMFAIQIFVNVGMTIGIMPITGIPLPFMSYGGSPLIADFIGVGLLANVHMRRTL
jgi:rod shape determining protein RodA